MRDQLYHEPDARELADLDRAARTLDPWTIYRRRTHDEPVTVERLASQVSSLLGAEAAREIFASKVPMWTRRTADRWMYDRLLADPPLLERRLRGYEHLIGTRCWHPVRDPQLVLLPTTTQWLTPAWSSYFGFYGRPDGQGGLAAAIRQWEQRWGAALVASWGTMLQFVVARQPAPGDQAWELAGQLLAVGDNLQVSQSVLAIVVSRSDAWFLHDRP
ncbi:DUF4253 domain-containing protein [Polymorphospora sp. NPDC050346]|uniref:DUF4253 domain-containing protein n=1 Tax=Polymorphospora sp. NPDC050346 TaxID=3155780 RepID=UPI0033CC8C2D